MSDRATMIALLRAQLAAHESAATSLRLAIRSLVGQGPKRLSDSLSDSLSDKGKSLVGQGISLVGQASRGSSSEIYSYPENISDLEDLDSEEEAAAARAEGLVGQADKGLSDKGLSDKRTGQARLKAELAGCWDGVGGISTSGSMMARIGEVLPLVERLARERSVEPVALFGAACRRFKADHEVKVKRLGLRVLLSQLEQWVDDAPPTPPNGGAPAVSVPARRLLNPRLPAKEGAA